MVRNGEFGFADVVRVLRRCWWVLPTSVVICAGLVIGTASVLPKKYTSQTVVLVAKPTVPDDYVKPVVTEDLSRRLASMKEQILSRTRLEPVIEKFDLYRQDRANVHMEELVDRLRTAIEISPLAPMAGTEDRSLPGFSVSVTFKDPQLAQQICTSITSMFMEQNASALEQQASRTTSFLTQQLDEAKRNLDEQDAKLAQFKRERMGSLPEQEQSNLGVLMSLNSQLDATTQALSRAQQEKAFDESLLSQQEVSWKASQAGQNPDNLEDQLRTLQDQLATLEALYTPKHPDVVKKKSQIEELQKKIAEAPDAVSRPKAASRTVVEPSQIQQLRATLHQQDLNISDLTKRQAKIQEQIRLLQDRVQASPMVEQQLKELSRNYQSALDFYNDLLKKRENSAMATNLAHQQEGEQFRVLDPPSLPAKPSFPNMVKFASGGLGAGFALGLGILYILMLGDQTFHTEKDVEVCLKLPVLTTIPLLQMVTTSDMPAGLSQALDDGLRQAPRDVEPLAASK
jgi:polysaccharide chain length determinant protein (PEP-CTERM system associated)